MIAGSGSAAQGMNADFFFASARFSAASENVLIFIIGINRFKQTESRTAWCVGFLVVVKLHDFHIPAIQNGSSCFCEFFKGCNAKRIV